MRWALVLLVLLVLILILVLILFILLLLLLLLLSGDDVALSDRVPRFWSDRNGSLSRF